MDTLLMHFKHLEQFLCKEGRLKMLWIGGGVDYVLVTDRLLLVWVLRSICHLSLYHLILIPRVS